MGVRSGPRGAAEVGRGGVPSGLRWGAEWAEVGCRVG